MKTIYALTSNQTGPAGHGEPGEPYLTLATDGEWFTLGKPHPVFTDHIKAETYRKSIDKYNRYNITPLVINE